MKKILFFIAASALIACNETGNNKIGSIGPGTTSEDSINNNKNDSVSYPYTASYADDFKVGNNQHAQTVLNIWKNWDSGIISQSRDAFADSVTMVFYDGSVLKGNRDSIVNESQRFRDNYDTVSTHLEAVVPLHIDEKNETWVSVWGTEVTTNKSGKKDSMKLHETWRLNNNGKVYHVEQYSAKPPVTDSL